MSTDNRPLSPHATIYRKQWTMVYSILNRLTGIALSVGAFFLTCWLVALAMGASDFQAVQSFITSIIGRIMMFGWTWSLFYHLAFGIRHLIWDSGKMLELKSAELSGHIAFLASIAMTVLVWLCAYSGGV